MNFDTRFINMTQTVHISRELGLVFLDTNMSCVRVEQVYSEHDPSYPWRFYLLKDHFVSKLAKLMK